MKEVTIDNRRILVIRTPEGFFAYQNGCPHKGVPLSQGQLEGHTLTCSAHGWQFDIQTGCGVNPKETSLLKIPAKIEGEDVFIDADQTDPQPLVGPTLQADRVGHALAAAILEQNTGAKIVDRGSYIRIEAPSPCRLSRHLLERHLERPVRFPEEIELVMPSFKGRIIIESEQIVWMAGRGA